MFNLSFQGLLTIINSQIDIYHFLKARIIGIYFSKKERKEILNILGIEVEAVTQTERKDWEIKGGVKVFKIYPGKIRRNTDIRESFVFIKVNNQPITSVDVQKLETMKGGVMLLSR